MDLPPNARRHFAQKRIEDTAHIVSALEENRYKIAEEIRRVIERFYNSLALFSGGTIALSITYLGYLKTLSKPVVHKQLLTGSWVALFLCLTFSLFYLLFNSYSGHYYRDREYWEALKKKFETEANEIRNMNVANIRTPAEIDAFARPRLEAAQKSGENARRSARWEKFYLHLWIWSGRLARLGFLVGLGLLLAFAISNN